MSQLLLLSLVAIVVAKNDQSRSHVIELNTSVNVDADEGFTSKLLTLVVCNVCYKHMPAFSDPSQIELASSVRNGPKTGMYLALPMYLIEKISRC